MCLKMPGEIISIENQIGKVSFSGMIKNINLSFLPKAKVGDHVFVLEGVALKVL